MPIDTQQGEVTPFAPLIPIAQQMESLQCTSSAQPASIQSVETPCTLHSNGTMSTAPSTTSDIVPEQLGFGLNKDSVATLQAIARNSAAESQQHNAALSALDKLTNSGNIPTSYHVLATLAALSGNFGPAVAIQEQKRKAAIGKDMFPVLSQINRLKALGKYDEAKQLAEDAASRVGRQAPEIVPILSKIASDISTKQIQLQQEKTWQGIVSDSVPKDDVNRPLVDSWGKALKGGMILGAAQVGELMSKLVPHIQVIKDQIVRSGLLTGQNAAAPMQEVFDPSSLKGTVPASVQGETQLTLDQVANVMRGGPPINGWTKEALQSVIGKYQQREAQIEVGGKVPLTPEYNAALLRVPGMTPERIATRNITPDEAESARLEQQRTNVQLAEAPILATNRTDVTKIASVGHTVL